ncbi:unnamed protein product [Urochloa humidicola]
MFVTSVVQFWSKWGLRTSVFGSLAAYAILGLLSGARWHSAYGWRSILRWAVVLILWAAVYQAAELAAKGALGSLSLSSCNNVSAEKQQVIVFWASFLLLHLGGPDNMTAYALEDNMLSLRKVVQMVLQLLGVMYAIWNYIYRAHSRVLFAAAVIMFVAGSARYVERACALWRANLDNMQDSSKKPEPRSGGSTSTHTSTEVAMESHDQHEPAETTGARQWQSAAPCSGSVPHLAPCPDRFFRGPSVIQPAYQREDILAGVEERVQGCGDGALPHV